MLDRLSEALRSSRADYTEIRLERSWVSVVAYRGSRLEGANSSLDIGGFVRCLNRGYGWGVASFTDIERMAAMVSRAHEISLAVRLDQPIRLAEVPSRRQEIRADLDGDVRGVPLGDKQILLERLNQEMLGSDRRVVDTQAAYRDEVTEFWFGNSEGTLLYELRPDITLSAVAIAREDGLLERGLESVGRRGGWRSVQDNDTLFRQAARRAISLLTAPRVKSGVYPVVLDPKLAGVLIHESIGHLSEADFVYENAEAGAMMSLGRRIGSELLTVGDDGSAVGLRGSLSCDDEGTPTQNTLLVQNGVLVGRLHSRETAARMGERPTGNARSISFRHPPLVRLTNTYVANGRGTFDDLIRDTHTGIYCCDALGGQTHLNEFSVTSGYGYFIRDGKLAELIKPAVLSGNLFQTLGRIDAIAGDFRWNQLGGGCGKAGQGPLPVAEGAPHLRIAEALLGGEPG